MTPLVDLKVLDFSHVIAGPFATFYLAQLGAQVTKIEPPSGDVMRGHAPSDSRSTTQFAAFNAGKSFLALDLKSTEGRAHAIELARTCDVLLDNFRPGVLERYGLGFEAVRTINPQVIYCSVSGYGTHFAPWREKGAYDHIIQAATGMAMMAGESGDPPMKTGFPVVDVMTGVLAAFAITAAVQERVRTGQGRHIDVSMWAAGLQLMYPFAVDALASGQSPQRVGNKGYSGSPASEYFPAQCGGFIAIGANTSAQITKLYRAIGWSEADAAADLESTPGFARARDPQAFRDKLAAALLQRSAQDWEDALQAAGVPAARVRSLAEFTNEAQSVGALMPTMLEFAGGQVATPGLGWQT